jgi:hypothetical protein
LGLLAKYLRHARPTAILLGFDNAYFAHCLTGAAVLPERYLDEQFYGDVRSMSLKMLSGCDDIGGCFERSDGQSVQSKNLITGLKRMNLKDMNFRSSELLRLSGLQDHIANDRLTHELDRKPGAVFSG